MKWWPFGRRKLEAPLNPAQQAQIEESVTRIKEESYQRVESAKTLLEAASAEAVQAVDRRRDETNFLRDALKTLIDRKTNGRYDLSRES